jgi:phosphatidylserine/phosphatidylglycerophosphate/cardiolipin synthase-like enzyme
MEIFSRLTHDNLAPRFVRILLASLDCEPGRVVIVTPWIKNVRLPIEGHQASHFGTHLSEATLDEVLARVARRHELHVVVKAPQELVDLRDVKRLVAKVESRERLLTEEELAGSAIRDELIADLNADITQLVDGALRHYDTVEFALRLREYGAHTHFLYTLHAKLLWTPLHAFFGSANFTNGGFSWNDELMAEVTEPQLHAKLGQTADGFLARAVAAGDYDFGQALKAAKFDKATFHSFLSRIPQAEYPHLANALTVLTKMVR